MRLVALFAGIVLVISCSSETPVSDSGSVPDTNRQITDSLVSTTDTSHAVLTGYTSAVFETPGLGWGYKIYENGTLFINQPHIPAIQGNKGFSSQEKAQITADFAILKLQQGFVPPTISPKELDSLGVLE